MVLLTPGCELDGLTQESGRLDKSSLAIAFYMDRQKDERVRRVTITYDTEVLSTDGAIHRWMDDTDVGRLLLDVGGILDRHP